MLRSRIKPSKDYAPLVTRSNVPVAPNRWACEPHAATTQQHGDTPRRQPLDGPPPACFDEVSENSSADGLPSTRYQRTRLDEYQRTRLRTRRCLENSSDPGSGARGFRLVPLDVGLHLLDQVLLVREHHLHHVAHRDQPDDVLLLADE